MHVLRSRCAQAQLSSLTAHASAHKLQAGLALVLDGLAAQREARGAAQRGLAHSCVVCGLSRRALCRHDALGFEKHVAGVHSPRAYLQLLGHALELLEPLEPAPRAAGRGEARGGARGGGGWGDEVDLWLGECVRRGAADFFPDCDEYWAQVGTAAHQALHQASPPRAAPRTTAAAAAAGCKACAPTQPPPPQPLDTHTRQLGAASAKTAGVDCSGGAGGARHASAVGGGEAQRRWVPSPISFRTGSPIPFRTGADGGGGGGGAGGDRKT